MPVECERAPGAQPTHRFEAHAINETEIAPSRRQARGHRRPMQGFVDPDDAQYRDDGRVEHPRGVQTKSRLAERKGLDEHVARRHERFFGSEQIGPDSARPAMLGIVGVQHREKRARVDECHRRLSTRARWRSWAMDRSLAPDRNRPAASRARARFTSTSAVVGSASRASTLLRISDAMERPLAAANCLSLRAWRSVSCIWVLTMMTSL